MRTEEDIETMRKLAYEAQGWTDDGTLQPVSHDEKAREDRAYDEGVEAGLLYALNRAGPPLPR